MRTPTRRPGPPAQARPAAHDQATRSRLLQTARRLFPERGYQGVGVREICRGAGANIAAVNYHFGGKLGLYTEVVQAAIDVLRETNEAAMQAPPGAPGDERLRTFLRVFLRNLIGKGRGSWIHKLMSRELDDPTPALNLVVEQAIRPRLEYLSAVAAELIGCDPADQRVWHTVASIQGQCLIYLRNPIGTRLASMWPATPLEIDAVADHIAEFSLAGIRAIAQTRPGVDLAVPRPSSG
jgi:TetR/AcrR family transcriptional regulator, regulator of cefoperazone and chloramphenicol sensitivity